MEKNGDKITTIEELAGFIYRTMATKDDIANMATKDDLTALEAKMATKDEMNAGFSEVHTRLDHLDARVGRIEADIHELQEQGVKRHEFEDALHRIRYMEKKLGIESGV